MEGCAIVLQPMIMVENANMLNKTAIHVDQCSAEISAGRVESLKEGDALRKQLLNLALGGRELVVPQHNACLESAQQPKQIGDKA